MKDIYEPDLDAKIRDFLERKARKYPELHLFDDLTQKRADVVHKRPPRVLIHEV
jgi:hypothetical protein